MILRARMKCYMSYYYRKLLSKTPNIETVFSLYISLPTITRNSKPNKKLQILRKKNLFTKLKHVLSSLRFTLLNLVKFASIFTWITRISCFKTSRYTPQLLRTLSERIYVIKRATIKQNLVVKGC